MQPSSDDYQNDGALQNRFQKVLRSLVLYVQARHLLFGLEFQEAFEYFSKRTILALLAFVFLVFGLLFLTLNRFESLSHLHLEKTECMHIHEGTEEL